MPKPTRRYLGSNPIGGPDVLADVHAEMWEWVQQQNLALDIDERSDGIHWTARTEQFHTDPNLEPDRGKWSVEVGYLLR